MEHLEAPHWERRKGGCIFPLLGILASSWYCSVGGKARLRNSPPGEFSLNQSSLGRSYRPFLSTLKYPQTPNLGDNSSVLQMFLSKSEFPTMAGSLIALVFTKVVSMLSHGVLHESLKELFLLQRQGRLGRLKSMVGMWQSHAWNQTFFFTSSPCSFVSKLLLLPSPENAPACLVLF